MNANSFAGHMDHLIEVYLAQGLIGKERDDFESHCAKCEPCHRNLEETREFETTVFQALEPDRSPDDLEERLIYSFREKASQRKHHSFFTTLYHSRLLRIIAVPIAALLLITIGMQIMDVGHLGNPLSFTKEIMSFPSSRTAGYDKMPNENLARQGLSTSPAPQSNYSPEKYGLFNAGASDHNETYDGESKSDSLDFISDKSKNEYRSIISTGGGAARKISPQPQPVLNTYGDNKGKSIASGLQASVGEPLSPDRKIIKSGALAFEVESFETAYQKVVAILTEEKGYIASSSNTKLPNGKVQGEIIIRILPERFDTVTLKLRSLGELKNQQVTSEDVSKQYVDIMARIKNSKALEERFVKLIAEKKGDVKDFLEVEKELANVREKIERLQGEIKYYDNLVSLATIRLNIMEKDIGNPVEYIQTQSANITVAVSDVEKAYQQSQKIVHDLKGQVVESQLNDQDKRVVGNVKAYVDAEVFAGLLGQLKGLGEVKYAYEGQQQKPPEGMIPKGDNVPIRKERGLVTLTLNPPSGEYIKTQRARIELEVTDVDSAYAKLQNIATSAEAKILNANLNKGTYQTTATIICQIDAERFRALVDSIKSNGKVKSATTDEHQEARGIDPKSTLQAPIRKEPGTIEISIISPEPIVSEDKGIWATIKNTLKGSIGGLLWSLQMLIVGVMTLGPWILLIILIIFLVKRLTSKKAVVNNPTTPTAPVQEKK